MIHLAAGTYALDSSPFSFDGLTRASEVRLIGTSGTTLQAATANAPLFNLSSGAPLVTLRGLTLRGQVVMEGGELHVEGCTFVDSGSELGGALKVSGGALKVDSTTFIGCNATRGGAVHVSGGAAVFSGCTFEGCSASEANGGGAVWVEGTGSVVLRERTHLRSNHAAGSLDSIHVAGGGSVRYSLPAPLAHYVDSARDGLWTENYEGQPSLALSVDAQYPNYPRACAAGLYGDSEITAAQSSALCSGLCPVAKLVKVAVWRGHTAQQPGLLGRTRWVLKCSMIVPW